ncbi:MAG TPA: hypothetical protein VK401_02625, partial [Propionibacteriaceae bacterium]|nr:hypothetical protein [Propionibacteriaceae bacterium]
DGSVPEGGAADGGFDAQGSGADGGPADDSADAAGPMTDEGARRRPRDRMDIAAQETWAQEVYDEIVADPQAVRTIAEKLGSVQRASGAVGFTPEEITQIRDHLMVQEHLLDDYAGGLELRRFDPSAQIAEAWQRLREGTVRDSDIVLLEHELAESTYLQSHPGASYREAHDVANQQFDWYALVGDEIEPGQAGAAASEADVLRFAPTVDDPVDVAGPIEEPTVGRDPGPDGRFLPPGALAPPFVSLGIEAVKDGVAEMNQPTAPGQPPLDWRRLFGGN